MTRQDRLEAVAETQIPALERIAGECLACRIETVKAIGERAQAIANRLSAALASSQPVSGENRPDRLLYGAWACLSGADSVLSLIFHRYRSMLPEDVQRDVEATYVDCRRMAERLQEVRDG